MLCSLGTAMYVSRVALGLSTAEFGRLLGYSQPSVSAWEGEKRAIPEEAVANWLSVLWQRGLLGGEGDVIPAFDSLVWAYSLETTIGDLSSPKSRFTAVFTLAILHELATALSQAPSSAWKHLDGTDYLAPEKILDRQYVKMLILPAYRADLTLGNIASWVAQQVDGWTFWWWFMSLIIKNTTLCMNSESEGQAARPGRQAARWGPPVKTYPFIDLFRDESVINELIFYLRFQPAAWLYMETPRRRVDWYRLCLADLTIGQPAGTTLVNISVKCRSGREYWTAEQVSDLGSAFADVLTQMWRALF